MTKTAIGMFSGNQAASFCLMRIIAVGMLFALLSTSTALAQCERFASAETNIKSLSSADDKIRIAAAGALIGEGIKILPMVMAELKEFKGQPDRWPQERQLYYISITDILRTLVSNSFPAIQRFRECRDESTMKPLVLAAKSQNPNMRVNSMLVLGNTVDNTTICFVLHQLRDPQISVNGRANLLGVTLAVASYSYKENKKAIEDTLDIVGKNIPSAQGDLSQTQKLMSDIRTRLKASTNADTLLPNGLRKYCAEYNYGWPPTE